MDLNSLQHTDPKIKFGFAKQLVELAASQPELLYRQFDEIASLLDSPNNIIKWTAVAVIAHLSSVDTDKKVDAILRRLVTLLHGGRLITSNNTMAALLKIASQRPDLKGQLLADVVSIVNDKFETEECKQIAIGKAVELLTPFAPGGLTDICGFKTLLQAACSSTRNATRKKGERLKRLLKNH